LIDLRNCALVTRVNFLNFSILVNDLRLVIAHSINLVRDFVEARLSYHDSNQFVPAEFESVALDLFGRPSLIGERIKGQFDVLCSMFGA